LFYEQIYQLIVSQDHLKIQGFKPDDLPKRYDDCLFGKIFQNLRVSSPEAVANYYLSGDIAEKRTLS